MGLSIKLAYIKSLVIIGVPVCAILLMAGLSALNNSSQTTVTRPATSITDLPAPAPPIVFYSRDHVPVTLEHHRPILILFWATWCPPCVEEFPDLVKLADFLARETDVAVIAISEDERWRDIDGFMKKITGGFKAIRIFLDKDQKAASAFGTAKYPEAYFIDRDQMVVRKFVGKQLWNHPEMRDWMLRRSRK